MPCRGHDGKQRQCDEERRLIGKSRRLAELDLLRLFWPRRVGVCLVGESSDRDAGFVV